MIASVAQKLPRGSLFLAFNMVAVLFVVMFLFAPVLSHFSSRGDDISENAAQLVHFRKIVRGVTSPANRSQRGSETFLAGTEERVVSADLQANLKTIATAAGANLLGIRGLPGSRSQQIRMVAVNMEMEGSLATVRDVIGAIENQTPFLFVSEVFLRSSTDGDAGSVRVELKVQGAMRDGGGPALTETGPR